MTETGPGAERPRVTHQQLVQLARTLRRPPPRPVSGPGSTVGLTWSGDPYDAPRTGSEAVQREVDRLVAIYREQREAVAPKPHRPDPAA